MLGVEHQALPSHHFTAEQEGQEGTGQQSGALEELQSCQAGGPQLIHTLGLHSQETRAPHLLPATLCTRAWRAL